METWLCLGQMFSLCCFKCLCPVWQCLGLSPNSSSWLQLLANKHTDDGSRDWVPNTNIRAFFFFNSKSEWHGETQTLHPLLQPPNAHDTWGWTTPKPGTQHSIKFSHNGGRNPSTCAIIHWIPGCWSEAELPRFKPALYYGDVCISLRGDLIQYVKIEPKDMDWIPSSQHWLGNSHGGQSRCKQAIWSSLNLTLSFK